jgi:Fe-S-cluster containining protein
VTDKKQKSLSLDELMELEGNAPFDPFAVPEDKRGKERKKRPKRPSKETLKKALKENKHYLPVLSLNDPTMWPPAPMSARRHFTDELATETCLSNCCGVNGVFSGCCRLDPDDLEHVLGPVKEKWVKKFLRHARKKGWNYKRSDVVIDYEEGKLLGERFFNGHPIFSKPTSYPMMRFQVLGPRFGCKFLNPNNGMCGIYEQRPDMCRGYYCQYVKKNFLVKTKDKPNTWRRVDVGGKKEEE